MADRGRERQGRWEEERGREMERGREREWEERGEREEQDKRREKRRRREGAWRKCGETWGKRTKEARGGRGDASHKFLGTPSK
jgi:hypothetical protein